MQLTILGSGDAFCSGGRFNTCLKLDGPSGSMLVDCGATSMLALARAGVDRNAISTILFTHFHGDHFGGLPFFLLDGRFVAKRRDKLTLVGPKGSAERCRQMVETAFPGFWDGPQVFPIEVIEITPDAPRVINGISVTAFPAVHDERAGPCQSYRFETPGKVLAFSGDTAWTEALVPLSANADVFLCECYTPDLKLANHLDWQTLTDNRDRLTARRLILTHMGPPMLAYTGPLAAERAFDGMVVTL